MSKTTVIHHSADFDGIFCREIARKFLPDAELIGWDFADKPLAIPDGQIYILDIPVDRVFGMSFVKDGTGAQCVTTVKVSDYDSDLKLEEQFHLLLERIIWIDHHKSSIETHPTDIPGYRIDGVAACRLAWQWFMFGADKDESMRDAVNLLAKPDYAERRVSEPLAVRLAGEYDIWDKRDPDAELLQHGLRSEHLHSTAWDDMLDVNGGGTVTRLLNQGRALQYAKTEENSSIIKSIGFTLQWEGLTFLACNAARYNSHLFTAGLTPDHDACFGFKWTGKDWSVSLYHAPGKEHHDLSLIAAKHGGGGHRGACGFQTDKLPFL